jgi:FkbM family methyltransferase
MVKKILRSFLNKFNYDISKLNHGSEKFRKKSDVKDLNFYDTPTGKYYLPAHLKRDIVANDIKNGNYFEPEVIEVAKSFIKKGTAVLDVGANYGQMSVVFSKIAGDEGKVYAFEAEPIIYNILLKTFDANGCKNVKVIPGAVHNKMGEKLVFPEPDFKRFDSYGSYGIDPNAKNGRKVESITIDSLQISEPISFMKVDIQGSDLFALQGAKDTILKNKMPILFEFEQQLQDEFHTSFDDYVNFVKSINYRFEKIIMGINYLIVPNE